MRRSRLTMLVVIAALVVGAAMWWQAADPDDRVALTARAPVTETLPSPRVPPSGTSRPSTPEEAPPGTQLTAVYMTKMGQAVLDETGAVLFRYERDNPHKARSACLGDCAAVWIPITTTGTPVVTGIDPAIVDTIKRPEGAKQVTLAGWPLYKFANARPGEWTGQGTDHLWFVVEPDGQRNLNCLPAPVQ
ncbi:hypothetical protein [Amycolatopsis sp. lyj-90]|uniref:COG4315 family predicted lipoprotein n=1 Tax=Amycolatopsis sp. lyj-90 TaxID=2789285 RepID=UPI00397CBE89